MDLLQCSIDRVHHVTYIVSTPQNSDKVHRESAFWSAPCLLKIHTKSANLAVCHNVQMPARRRQLFGGEMNTWKVATL